MGSSRSDPPDQQQHLSQFAVYLARFGGAPELALQAIERYELGCLRGADEARRRSAQQAQAGDAQQGEAGDAQKGEVGGAASAWAAVIERLARQAHGLDLGARLAWARYARSELEAATHAVRVADAAGATDVRSGTGRPAARTPEPLGSGT